MNEPDMIGMTDMPAPNLITLPSELLQIIVAAADSAFNVQICLEEPMLPRIVLPAIALACRAILGAARASQHALRCKDIRLMNLRIPILPGDCVSSPMSMWASLLLLDRALVLHTHGVVRAPPVIDLQNCDVPSCALAEWAQHPAKLQQPPIRALALVNRLSTRTRLDSNAPGPNAWALTAACTHPRPWCSQHKCHSVSGHSIVPVLQATPRLLALVFTSQRLGASALDVIGGLTELRVLCLTECTVGCGPLIACVGRLRALRCLLLGGARLLQDEVAPVAPTMAPTAAAAMAAAAPDEAAAAELTECTSELGVPGALSNPMLTNSVLRVVEATFVPSSEVCALASACPLATLLDCCASDAAELEAGLQTLRRVLFDESAASACEAAGCVAETAFGAALSCRCHGFLETPLHRAAIEGDAAAAALLLEHGAAPNLKDAKGCTPLVRAVFWGAADVVELLVRSGRCDLAAANHAAESPTYLAALRGHAECLRLLLAADQQATAETNARASAKAAVKAAAQAAKAVAKAADEAANEAVANPGDGVAAEAEAPGTPAEAEASAAAADGAAEGAAEGAPSCAAATRSYHDGYTPLHAAVIARSIACLVRRAPDRSGRVRTRLHTRPPSAQRLAHAAERLALAPSTAATARLWLRRVRAEQIPAEPAAHRRAPRRINRTRRAAPRVRVHPPTRPPEVTRSLARPSTASLCHAGERLPMLPCCTAPMSARRLRLYRHGCDASMHDERGQTAAHVARAKGYEHLSNLLATSTPRTPRSRPASSRPSRGKGAGQPNGVPAAAGTTASAVTLPREIEGEGGALAAAPPRANGRGGRRGKRGRGGGRTHAPAA